jgi:hypothetical protein
LLQFVSKKLFRTGGGGAFPAHRIDDIRDSGSAELVNHGIFGGSENTGQFLLDALANWTGIIRFVTRHGKGVLLFDRFINLCQSDPCR